VVVIATTICTARECVKPELEFSGSYWDDYLSARYVLRRAVA